MILGTDTGFFIQHTAQHPRVLQIWSELLNGDHALIISTLSINELLVYFYRRGHTSQAENWLALLTQSERIHVIPVSSDIAALSARYRLGLQLPTVDAIILTTCIHHNCDRMVTT